MSESNRFVALLRGINVGGNHKVSMTSLKELFAELGFTDISTYINSGNIIFNTNSQNTLELCHKIESALANHYGFNIPIVLVTAQDLHAIKDKLPKGWTNDIEQKTDIIFLWEPYNRPETVTQIHTNPQVDQLIYLNGIIVWHINRENYSQSGMHDFIGTDVYKYMTARNINTVRKLIDLIDKI